MKLFDLIKKNYDPNATYTSASVLLYYKSNQASVSIKGTKMGEVDGIIKNINFSKFMSTDKDTVSDYRSDDVMNIIKVFGEKMTDYTNKNSLIKLAKEINPFYIDEKARYLAKLHFADLMIAEMPWYGKVLLNRAYKKHGYDVAVDRLFSLLMISSKDHIETFYNEFLHHLVHGKDQSDSKSAGGFNQVEIFMIESIFGLIGK